jgi:uncharacterized membrane protein
MKRSVLFLGEGPLSGAARYLAAILTWAKIPFDHVPDGRPLPARLLARRYAAVLLSDYRHDNFSRGSERWLVRQVQSGTGLLMIGGWASFTGLVGGYAGTAIEALLPVRCVAGDDRVNWACGSVLRPSVAADLAGAPILQGLEWRHPPVLCGYHRVFARAGSRTLLELRDLRFDEGRPALGRAHPGLVIREGKEARSAAFMSDCAPHWAGGLVDWGTERVTVRKGKTRVEVGDQYLRFFSQLIRWVAGG